MRVLIIGGTGFAGRYLTAELLRQGDEVWVAGRGTLSEAAGSSQVDGESVPSCACDVTDRASVSAALAHSRPEAVVLLAGIASPPIAQRDPEAAFRVHALGAVHVLEEALRHGAGTRVLVVTSSEVYGPPRPEDLPLREDSPLRPHSVYGASKAAADLAAGAFAASRDADVVRVRPFNHTGPGQAHGFVCPDFASQVASIARGRMAPVLEVGNLTPRRDFTDVRDIARGYVAVLKRGTAGEVYNLCSGNEVRIGQILSDLCRMAGIEPEVRSAAGRLRKADVPVAVGSATRADEEFSWRPEIPWQDTLKDLLEAEMAALGGG